MGQIMNRTKQNFIVDLVAFILFTFLAITGFLIHYILPAGSGRFSVVLGLNRHQWGDLHFGVAIAMLLVLAIHLIIHWNWIICVIKGRVKERIKIRLTLAIIALVALLIMELAILFAR